MHLILPPISLVAAIIKLVVFSITDDLVVFKMAFKSGAIIKIYLPLPMFKSFSELSFIFLSIFIDSFAHAFELVIFPVPGVLILIRVNVEPLAMGFVIKKLPLVHTSISID